MLVSDNQSKCQVCGQDGEIGKCNTAQDNGHVEFCDEEYVCYFVYESKVPNCIKDVLFCKFSFQSFMVWIVSLSTLGTVGVDLDLDTDKCYSQNTDEVICFSGTKL